MTFRLLVLGGGGFLGYHIVEQALRDGADVTVLSRSGRPPVAGVETLRGDRDDELPVLRDREWDAVVDTFTDPAPNAPAVRRTASMLSSSVGLYCYVSGMSVYAPDGPAVPTENSPVRRAGHEPDDDPLQARSLAKLAGEAAVHELFDGPVLIPRVGIMVGPRDPSQRFTWWPVRFHHALAGGAPTKVTGPGRPDRPVQYSDARDIARWLARMAAEQRGGTFNTVGPLRDAFLVDVLADCLTAARRRRHIEEVPAGPDVSMQWQTDEAQLRELLRDVAEEDRPLWYPEDQIPQRAVDSRAAQTFGLTFRSTLETATDTLTWALGNSVVPLADFPEPS